MAKTVTKKPKQAQSAVRSPRVGGAGGKTNRGRRASATSGTGAKVLLFATRLRELAGQAEQLHEDAAELRLSSLTTKNLQTRYRNKLRLLVNELQNAGPEFTQLVAAAGGSGSEDGCSHIVESLRRGRFESYLQKLTEAVESLAVRSGQGVGEEHASDLLSDMRFMGKISADLISIAEEIERQVKEIRRQPSPANRNVLPQDVEDVLVKAEQAGKNFIATLANCPSQIEKLATDSGLAWLQRVSDERKRLYKAMDDFVKELAKFSDEHLMKAEQAGHEAAKQLFEYVADNLERVRARRNMGEIILKSSMGTLQLGLTLSEEGLWAAGHLGCLLKSVEDQLKDVGVFLTRKQQSTAARSRAELVDASDLPDWTELAKTKSDGLQLIVAAIIQITEGGDDVTKIELNDKLQSMRPRSTAWDSWVHRKLQEAMKAGIVIQTSADKNKTVGHRFSLVPAAIGKYGTDARAFQ